MSLDQRQKIKLKILLPLIGVLIFLNLALENNESGTGSDTEKVVKVLVFAGYGTDAESVRGVKNCLDKADSENLIENVRFDYSTSSIINSEILSAYDVLIMPGGEGDTYLESSNIDSEAIKNFIRSGKGYVGICAGAYSASRNVEGLYDGWGIAPNVNSKKVNFQGNLSIGFTKEGQTILGETGQDTIYHSNGPAMYENNNNSGLVLATYSDDQTGYGDYAAIIYDKYGTGNVLLTGSHPELDPQKPLMLDQMVLEAYQNNTTNNTTPA